MNTRKDDLINRMQMLVLAGEHNIYVSPSTIHLWANSKGFPRVVGKDGRFLLYSKQEFISFIRRRLKDIEESH